MIIGTAGHIDHGKTSLVRAISGVAGDRLPEERARGITLDLGYAYLPEEAGVRLGFIDVPGHEKLIHNMLAGASGIDFLLLVVAADDGPMPQTREHLAIAELLGIRRAAVALSKCDLVTPQRQAEAAAQVRALLAGGPFADAPLFALALGDEPANHPDNQLAALIDHLHAAARQATGAARGGRFRLAIDRAFSLAGIGSIVTGTVFSGQVEKGAVLSVSPLGKSARLRGLRVHNQPAERACAGERVALNLSGDFSHHDLRRGMWALDPRQHLPIERFCASLRLCRDEKTALRHWTAVHVHLGAEGVTGRLALLDCDSLQPGGTALAEIVLDRPIAAVAGDRCIVRNAAANKTLAGGTVLDIFPPSRHKRRPARLAALRAAVDAAAYADPALALAAELAQSAGGVDLARFAANWNLADQEALALWSSQVAVEISSRAAHLGFAAAGWAELAARLLAALADEHARAPDLPGVERERLRRLTQPDLARAAFDHLVDQALAGGQISQTASWLHLPEHRLTLAPEDARLWQTLAPLLAATPWQPPRVRDVASASGMPENAARHLLRRLARCGLVYQVAHDHFFTAEAVAGLADIVGQLCAANGAARAAALRDAIGGGRKVAIHILEFFDRIGYTRRRRSAQAGVDEHLLRANAALQQWQAAPGAAGEAAPANPAA